MALKSRLELRQQQRLSLTPELQTRLALLRLPATDLDEVLSREAARNPFLVFERARAASVHPPTDDLRARDIGFQESLRQQIGAMGLAPQKRALVEFLIGELREDGYLDCDLDDLAAGLSLDPAPLAEALTILQSCEPAGIGARNLAECLALQLVETGLTRAEADATVAHLPAFAARDWATLSRALGLDAEAVKARAALLRGLSPRPVQAPPRRHAEVLRPDLRLERGENGVLSVSLAQDHVPRVALDTRLAERAKAERFEPELLTRARTLLAALDQRGRTLRRIGAWLVQNQTAFFFSGVAGLGPASRGAVAQELGLHPSTISRAVQGKAIDVDGRLWPLSVFFSPALAGSDGPVSARAVQKRIADLIAAEPGAQPLSDDAITGLLRAEGVDIARRTVAKYRQGLRIPSSSERRRIAASRRGE